MCLVKSEKPALGISRQLAAHINGSGESYREGQWHWLERNALSVPSLDYLRVVLDTLALKTTLHPTSQRRR